jgi:hypothetical protein
MPACMSAMKKLSDSSGRMPLGAGLFEACVTLHSARSSKRGSAADRQRMGF